jgi:hypothetical protein
MLNAAVYRAGWIPVVFALVLVAFSLGEQPAGLHSSLSTQGFDGAAATRLAARLAADPAFGRRRPGDAGDDALAARVGRQLHGAGFRVQYRRVSAPTVDGNRELVSVIAKRSGFSDRRLVLVADRSSVARTGPGSLSATATLLELARTLGGRTLGRTLVLASVSGGPGGGVATDLRRAVGGPVDAVIVLGDLGTGPDAKPWVVPWSDRSRSAPLVLRRTVRDALRTDVGAAAGDDGLFAQLGRYAFPLTLGAQGPLVASGVPAVLVSSSGERGARGDLELDAGRLEPFGRAVLRAATALDAGGPVPPPAREVVLAGQVLPVWAIRLLVGVLLLPVLLAIVDGLARVGRRRGRPGMWLRWALAAALPFVLVALLARALGAFGAVPATPTVLGPGVAPLDRGAIAALVLLVAVLGVGWLALRPLALRLLGVHGDAAEPGAAAASIALASVATLALWVVNPFAAGLVVPALHLWLFAVAPETRPARRSALILVALGLVPGLLVVLGYAIAFGLGPLQLPWTAVLALAGGAVPLGVALVWSVVLGSLVSVALIAARPRPAEAAREAVSVRGPRSYAGPGSLGGTESALRR